MGICSIKHKYLVTVRSFLAAKAVDMFDYVKPIQRDFDPVAYILHIGTNDLTREKNETKSAQKYHDLSRFLKQIKTKSLFQPLPQGEMHVTLKSKKLILC